MATNENKTATATFGNEAKNSGTIFNQLKPGQSPQYDSYLKYDDINDPLSNNAVYYDSIGTEPTYTNEAKS